MHTAEEDDDQIDVAVLFDGGFELLGKDVVLGSFDTTLNLDHDARRGRSVADLEHDDSLVSMCAFELHVPVQVGDYSLEAAQTRA